MGEHLPNTFVTIPIEEYEKMNFALAQIESGKKYFISEGGCGHSVKLVQALVKEQMVALLLEENDRLQQEYVKMDIKLWQERDKSLWKRIFKIPT